MGPRFLRLPEVISRTGLGRASIYNRIAEKRFPTPVPLGGHAVGWIESEISQWCEDRIREARGEPVAA